MYEREEMGRPSNYIKYSGTLGIGWKKTKFASLFLPTEKVGSSISLYIAFILEEV
jgi:hypothetical protein